MTACTSMVGESVITVYEKAMSRVWMDLESVTRKHGVERELEIVVRVSWKFCHPSRALCRVVSQLTYCTEGIVDKSRLVHFA